MSTEMVLPGDFLTPSKFGSKEAHDAVAGSGYLNRLQLVQSSSNICKKQKISAGNYIVVKGKESVVHDLSDSVDVFVLGWRPKAIRFAKGTVKMRIVYDPKSPEFRSIEKEAAVKDSGCMYGPEYLVYIPSVNETVTFHFNNPTLRQSASGMLPNIGKAITCTSELIERGRDSWHGPVILARTTALAFPGNPEETWDELKKHLAKFNSPATAEDSLEQAPASQEEERAR